MTPPDPMPNTAFEALKACFEAAGIYYVGVSGEVEPGLQIALGNELKTVGGTLIETPPDMITENRAVLLRADAWILGDLHNYYDSYRRIHSFAAWFNRTDKPLFLIIPGVEGPKCHRDFYRDGERIPPEWCHELALEADNACPTRDKDMLMAGHDGGPRNGVLTAIYDAAEEQVELGSTLSWGRLEALGGLTILFDDMASWAPQLSAKLVRYSRLPLPQKNNSKARWFGMGRGR